MVGHHCAWGTCTTNSARMHKVPEGTKWIPFPKPGKIRPGMTELNKKEVKRKTEKSLRWLYLCGRKDFSKIEDIKISSYVCSLHFDTLAGPTDECPEPYLATLSDKEQETRTRKKRNRKPTEDFSIQNKKKKTTENQDPSVEDPQEQQLTSQDLGVKLSSEHPSTSQGLSSEHPSTSQGFSVTVSHSISTDRQVSHSTDLREQPSQSLGVSHSTDLREKQSLSQGISVSTVSHSTDFREQQSTSQDIGPSLDHQEQSLDYLENKVEVIRPSRTYSDKSICTDIIEKKDKQTETKTKDQLLLAAKIDNMILRNEEITRKNENIEVRQPFSPELILLDKAKCKFYIGLFPKQFDALYSFLGPAKYVLSYWGKSKSQKTEKPKQNMRRHFTPKQELFITLLRLRTGFSLQNIAYIYNVSKSLISNIFLTWIQFIYLHFKELSAPGGPMFPSKEHINETLPKVFRPFKNVRCSIDCTEFFCEKPGNYAQQGNVYSSYKHHATFKALFAVTPHGAAGFVSDLFEGSIDDVEITKQCGILDHFQPGDLVMVDKGFKNIEELLLERQASIAIPPFLGKRKKFTEAEEMLTRKIAKARIHVERYNERVKKFKLIGNTIPLNLVHCASQMVFVACCLVNFQQPLCK